MKKIKEIRDNYNAGNYVNEAAIDPGENTYLAIVRRHIATGTEVSKFTNTK